MGEHDPFEHEEEVIEKIWNDNRKTCPMWHTLTNSERYLMRMLFDALEARRNG